MGKKKFSHQDEIQDSEENNDEKFSDTDSNKPVEGYSQIKLSRRRNTSIERKDSDYFPLFRAVREIKATNSKDWKTISLFSTSKIISKLNVAINEEEKTSKWSQNFSLTNSGTSGELRIEGQDGIEYDLGVTIEKGQGPFQLTNIITFRPLYILKNNYSRELLVKQIDVDKRKACWILPPNSEKPVYWYSSKQEKGLSVAINLGEGHEIAKK